jgi:hypothetical protein
MRSYRRLHRPYRARPADRSVVAEDRSAGGVRDRTGPEPQPGPRWGHIWATNDQITADNTGQHRVGISVTTASLGQRLPEGPGVVLGKAGHSSAELRMSHPTRQEGPKRPINRRRPRSPIGPLQRQYKVHRIFPAKSTARLHVTRRSTRPGRRQKVQLLRLAHRSFPNLGAGLTARPDATQDGRHGRLPTSRPGRLLPLPPGRQALPGHLPAWGMAGPATCRANPSRPGPPPAFWRARSQHPAGPPQAARRRGRQPPTTLRAWRLASRALKNVGVAGWRRDDPEDCWPTVRPPATPIRGQGSFRLPNPGWPIRSMLGVKLIALGATVEGPDPTGSGAASARWPRLPSN